MINKLKSTIQIPPDNPLGSLKKSVFTLGKHNRDKNRDPIDKNNLLLNKNDVEFIYVAPFSRVLAFQCSLEY